MVLDTKANILKRALEIVGSHEDLARRLNVRPIPLAKCLGGFAPVPDEIFLKAVDIVLENETRDLSLWQDEEPAPLLQRRSLSSSSLTHATR
jgi:hypothetical protein